MYLKPDAITQKSIAFIVRRMQELVTIGQFEVKLIGYLIRIKYGILLVYVTQLLILEEKLVHRLRRKGLCLDVPALNLAPGYNLLFIGSETNYPS